MSEENEHSIRLEEGTNFEGIDEIPNNKELLLEPRVQDSIDKEYMYELPKEQSIKIDQNPGFLEALNKLFGEQMIPYFETYFEPFLNGRKYECSENMCKLLTSFAHGWGVN